jgi:hypothetical protein
VRAALRTGIALLLWTALPHAPARADDAGWLPLRTGERWEYRVSRDHQYTPRDADIDRVFSVGTLLRAVSAPVGGAFPLRETLNLQPQLRDARLETESREGSWSRSPAGDLLLARVVSVNRDPPLESVYQPPLRWLPANVEPGARWRVGTLRWDGTEYALEAEALGFEDVEEGTSRWERCLKVRYAGPISGTTPIHTGPTAIRSGRIEQVVWFARGVGIVRETVTTEGEIDVPPDGATARVSELQTRRLVEHRPGE